MDRTVPHGAALLLDFIRATEVGRKDRASYDVIYANKQHKLSMPLTSMTLGDVIDAQRAWSKNHGSSAAGGYQFMRATLQGLAKELHLSGSQVLDPDLQDRLGYHLLKRRGYDAYMAGQIGVTEFAKRLAMEWASFPVLASTKGAHRTLKRGQSYYAGDGVNKALVAPETVEAVLAKVRQAPQPTPTVPDAPKPVQPRRTRYRRLLGCAARPSETYRQRKLTMAPIIRILLRYATFPLLYFGLINANEANDLIADPDIAQWVSLGAGMVAPILAEGWYVVSKRMGWTT